MLKKKDLEDMFTFKTLNLNPAVKTQILQTTGRGGVSKAADYISANCLLSEFEKAGGDITKVETKQDIWNQLHPATAFRLKAFTPCLAARYDELKDQEKNSLFEDHNWLATEKINGCRAWLIVYKGNVHLYSRNYSDVDCSLLEYWNNIDQEVNYDGIFAIDVEIKFEPGVDISEDLENLGIETDSTLEAMVALLHTYPEDAVKIQKKFYELYKKPLVSFNLIAPLYFNGKNYVRRTLGEGQQIYNEVIEFGQSIGLNLKPIKRCNGNRQEKEIFLDTILNAGGEGVVFHYSKGSYCTSENRSRTSFIKLKRSISATAVAGMGDQIDAYVSGFKPGSVGTANEGIIGALEFSIKVIDGGLEYEHHIASVPNITRAERQLATWNNADGLYPQQYTDSEGNLQWMSLNPDFDALVAELTGQALSAKSVRLEHPAMVMWRPERSPESCKYTKEFLNSQTTNQGIKY